MLSECQEVERRGRIGGHPSGGHVQEVGVVAVCISFAACHAARALDEHYLRRCPMLRFQEIRSYEGAAEPGADDHNSALWRHGLAFRSDWRPAYRRVDIKPVAMGL